MELFVLLLVICSVNTISSKPVVTVMYNENVTKFWKDNTCSFPPLQLYENGTSSILGKICLNDATNDDRQVCNSLVVFSQFLCSVDKNKVAYLSNKTLNMFLSQPAYQNPQICDDLQKKILDPRVSKALILLMNNYKNTVQLQYLLYVSDLSENSTVCQDYCPRNENTTILCGFLDVALGGLNTQGAPKLSNTEASNLQPQIKPTLSTPTQMIQNTPEQKQNINSEQQGQSSNSIPGLATKVEDSKPIPTEVVNDKKENTLTTVMAIHPATKSPSQSEDKAVLTSQSENKDTPRSHSGDNGALATNSGEKVPAAPSEVKDVPTPQSGATVMTVLQSNKVITAPTSGDKDITTPLTGGKGTLQSHAGVENKPTPQSGDKPTTQSRIKDITPPQSGDKVISPQSGDKESPAPPPQSNVKDVPPTPSGVKDMSTTQSGVKDMPTTQSGDKGGPPSHSENPVPVPEATGGDSDYDFDINQDNFYNHQGKNSNVKPPVNEEKQSDKTSNTVDNTYTEDVSQGSGHFMAYFLTAVVLCVAGYVVFHNKQKIFAFIVEGRNNGRRSRRPNSGDYKKLQPSMEEIMPSLEKSTTSTNYVY